jgi:hypothetical protein
MSTDGPSGITSQPSRGRPDGGFPGILRGVTLVAVVAGAVGSVALMLVVGHRNPSRLLLVLFVIWVLSPFVALLLANGGSKRWPVLTRATLHGLMLVITLGSLAIYGNVAFGPPRPKPAFLFLVVPLGSWLLIAIAISIAGLISGTLSRR